MDNSTVTFVILAVVVLIILGIVLRAMLSTSNPPQWMAFLQRRRQDGRPTQWKEWKDDE